ncbi:MAG: endonuclease/exonuclease/phosphatase family protein [Phycisphaerales bacterium]
MLFRTLVACALVALALPTAAFAQSQAPNGSQNSKQEVRPAGIWYGVKDARKKTKGAIRLAAYNVENLFDDKDDPALSGEYDDINEKTSEARLKALARAIKELDADVLCLEEVESKECLEWFRDKYLKGLGYDHVASIDASYYRGVEQSVLSRIPIKSARVYTGDDAVISDMESRRTAESAKRLGGEWAKPEGKMPERFQRSPLRVDLESADGYALTVFVVHFKAGADFDHQRELEALQTEQFVEEMLKENPDANVAVLGDYNGTPNDMNVKALRISDDNLVSAYDWRFDKKAPRDTFVTHSSGRSIDFIVMSPGLAADCVDGSYFVLGTLHAASVGNWRNADTIPPPEGYASDHYPVSIEIMPKPDRPASAFKRSGPMVADEEDRGTTARKDSDDGDAPAKPALKPAATNADADGPRPVGDAPAADKKLAGELRDAGWAYMLPEPKSKSARWGNKDSRTTWWPGYWKNTKTGAMSVAQPSGRGFMGDGQQKPKWRDGGSQGPVTWVEWLCSEQGSADR